MISLNKWLTYYAAAGTIINYNCDYTTTTVVYIFTNNCIWCTNVTAYMHLSILAGSIFLAVNKILLVSICQHRQT